MIDDPDRYISVAEAARRLGVYRNHVYWLIRRGRLRAVRVAGHWAVERDSVEAEARRRTAEAKAKAARRGR